MTHTGRERRGRVALWLALAAINAACSQESGETTRSDGSSRREAATTDAEPRDTAEGAGAARRSEDERLVLDDELGVVLLGTGTPNPVPDRSGPSVAVVAENKAYIVDCGPGVVRRAAAAAERGVPALAPERLTRAFITHLHSDHTVGLPDLILTPWPAGRSQPLEVYGPPGLEAMTDHLLRAYRQDINVRLEGNQPASPHGYEVIAHEVEPGEIYSDDRVRVTAFPVKHGAWKVAYGYRFETKSRRVVISGDTTVMESVVEACDGCDVLVHEVYAHSGWSRRSPQWQAYHRDAHTSSRELGELAARARAKRLVLYHQLLFGATKESVLRDIRQSYEGVITWGDDLMGF